jgi:hypothetical protein
MAFSDTLVMILSRHGIVLFHENSGYATMNHKARYDKEVDDQALRRYVRVGYTGVVKIVN